MLTEEGFDSADGAPITCILLKILWWRGGIPSLVTHWESPQAFKMPKAQECRGDVSSGAPPPGRLRKGQKVRPDDDMITDHRSGLPDATCSRTNPASLRTYGMHVLGLTVATYHDHVHGPADSGGRPARDQRRASCLACDDGMDHIFLPHRLRVISRFRAAGWATALERGAPSPWS